MVGNDNNIVLFGVFRNRKVGSVLSAATELQFNKPQKVHALWGFFYCAAGSSRERLALVEGTTKAKQDYCDVLLTVSFDAKTTVARLSRNGKGKVRDFTLPAIR